MATDVCKGVFDQILLKKRLKMTKCSNTCQSFRITAKALSNSSFHILYRKEICIWVGLPNFREGQAKNLG